MDEKEKAAQEAYHAECAAASAVRGRKVIVVSDWPRYSIPTGVVVIGMFGDVPKVLMGKRGPKVAKPGMLGIPAGYPQDLVDGEVVVEDPELTAQRELLEEVGLDVPLERLRLMGANVTKQFLYGEPRLMHHSFFLLHVTQEEIIKAKPDGDDLVELFWFSRDEVEARHADGQVVVADSYMPYIRKGFGLTRATHC